LSREHLSAISGITEKGKLYIQLRDKSFKGPDVVIFLQHLLKHIPGKIMVIWDGASIHRSKEIKKFLSSGGSERIHLERLPSYSPDLNPDEGVWQYLKCVCLKNVCCLNLNHLKQELKKAIRTLRSRKHIISGCFRRIGKV
jgi:transposase